MGLSLSGAGAGAAAGTAFGPWGTAIGAVAGAIFGGQKAPKPVTVPKIDIGQAVAESTSANAQNFGANAALSRRTNDFAQSEATRLLDKAIPGFSGLQSKLLAQVRSDLASQDTLPTEVSDNLARIAAEKGITRGTSGGFNNFSLVRDFGFNLVDWKNAQRAKALNTLSTVYGMAPRVNPMTPMATFVSPNAALGAQGQNAQAQFNADQGNANAQAAQSNYNRSLWGSAIASVAMAAAGTVSRTPSGDKSGAGDNPYNAGGLGLT